MGKKKNLKADRPMYTGAIMFGGNLKVKTVRGEEKTLRTDLGGMHLQRADQNKELLILTRQHAGYNELETGYIVRKKQYDVSDPPQFGLKADPDDTMWPMFRYADVIAWGYADGGLNDPTLFYSCQSTVEEELERERQRAEKGMMTHAEHLAKMKDLTFHGDIEDADGTERKCVQLRVAENDKIQVHAVFAEGEEIIDPETHHAKGLFHDCAMAFDTFRKQHPEITEMHFYTDEEVEIGND